MYNGHILLNPFLRSMVCLLIRPASIRPLSASWLCCDNFCVCVVGCLKFECNYKKQKDNTQKMSDKRASSEDHSTSKRQKCVEKEEEKAEEKEDEEHCIVCMRTEEELATADCPMREEHGCPRCNKASW